MFGALAERGINIALINTSEVRINVATDPEPRPGGTRMPEGGVLPPQRAVRGPAFPTMFHRLSFPAATDPLGRACMRSRSSASSCSDTSSGR